MNKVQLESRLKQVEHAIQQQNQASIAANNQLNVLLGIKQECAYWLQQLDSVGTPQLPIESANDVEPILAVEEATA